MSSTRWHKPEADEVGVPGDEIEILEQASDVCSKRVKGARGARAGQQF